MALFCLGNPQNKRGGRVRLQSIVMPLSEFDHAEKGDALYGIASLAYLISFMSNCTFNYTF